MGNSFKASPMAYTNLYQLNLLKYCNKNSEYFREWLVENI